MSFAVTFAPSTASPTVIGKSMTRSTPSIVNLGSSVTVTCRYMSPVLPPCLPGLPLPARRIFWPFFTPAGMRVLNFLPLALSETVAPLTA